MQEVERLRATHRRSRLEIYVDVLRTIKDGRDKPTHIMYGANLSWKPMQRILRSLVYSELIREIDVRCDRNRRTIRRYEITRKGLNAVRYFSRARDYLELIEAAKISGT